MKYFIVLFSLFVFNTTFAQELNCKVTVNASQIQSVGTTVDKSLFPDLERAIFNFMNNQRWTNDVFSEKEKIKCSLNITLAKSPAQNVFNAKTQFQVIRPIYGTTLETVTLQYFDQVFDFSYAPEDRQMIFNEQNYTNNLTSMLAFYSLMAIAIDYDSFSKFGGTPFIERAFNVSNLAGNSAGGPWLMDTDTRNRYWLIENIRSQPFVAFREGFYNYHRIALDDFANNPANSRKIILDFLNSIKSVAGLKQNSIIINTFFDAKSDEIINIFSEGTKQEKQQVFELVSFLDPDKTENYRKILK